ncbi:defensin-2-like [Temnothorax curvispinosus]|uniref:Defensin-2-like n=1 Tax=Temnothorax curvispinosus TaxID=300111 RepID=A0A6J1R3Q9_9HYME|nr:defensin-2-like [Temnothorax curvispinosus]
MKLLAILTVLAVLAYASANTLPAYASANTLPAVYDGPTYELTAIEDPANDEMESNLPPIRNRRVTCDLLSWQSKWLSINHSACAGKCLVQGRRGGRCRGGICVCRH